WFCEWFVTIVVDFHTEDHPLISDRCHKHDDERLILPAVSLRCGIQYKYILTWYSKYASILCRFLQVIATTIRFRKPIRISICFLVCRMPKVHRLYQQEKER